MKITSVSYGKTINVGNYQSVRLEYTVDVEDNQPAEVLAALKELVNNEETRIKQDNRPINK